MPVELRPYCTVTCRMCALMEVQNTTQQFVPLTHQLACLDRKQACFRRSAIELGPKVHMELIHSERYVRRRAVFFRNV